VAKSTNILEFHRFCLATPATERYRQAIAQVVRPGDVVVDIGAGAGSLSFFACQAGARHVYAIELDESLELGRLLAEQNGFADRVTFLKADARQVELPELGDALITNTLETLGLNGGMLDLVVDARRRLLKQGAAVLPARMGLHLAPVELPEFYGQRIGSWNEPAYGLDLSALHRFAANNMFALKADRAAFLAAPAHAAEVDLSAAQRLDVRGEAAFAVEREGVMHGLAGWFDVSLAPGIGLTNEPGNDTTGYNHAFLPLARPVAVRPGDVVRATLSTFNGAQWRWQVAVERQAAQSPGQPAAPERFDHATLWGFPISKEQLQPAGAGEPA